MTEVQQEHSHLTAMCGVSDRPVFVSDVCCSCQMHAVVETKTDKKDDTAAVATKVYKDKKQKNETER